MWRGTNEAFMPTALRCYITLVFHKSEEKKKHNSINKPKFIISLSNCALKLGKLACTQLWLSAYLLSHLLFIILCW